MVAAGIRWVQYALNFFINVIFIVSFFPNGYGYGYGYGFRQILKIFIDYLQAVNLSAFC